MTDEHWCLRCGAIYADGSTHFPQHAWRLGHVCSDGAEDHFWVPVSQIKDDGEVIA